MSSSGDSTTIPIRFVQELLSVSSCTSDKGLAWVGRAGIAPNLLVLRNARVTVEQFARLYRKIAAEADDETPGFFSRPLRNGTLKFLCLGMLGATNLNVALYRFSGFFRLVLEDISFDLARSDVSLRMALTEKKDLGAHRILILELMLMLVQGVASWMVGSRIAFPRIDLAYPAPPHVADYMHLYPGPVHFNQPVTALYFDLPCLDMPIRQDKAALSAFLRKAPAGWMYVSLKERQTTHRVRDYLREHLDTLQTIDDTARALHLSTRTLARRLAAEGTRFQMIKDTLRRDIAIDLICRTDRPIAAIGTCLGFDDPTAFNRAFRHWTGSPPGAYRKGAHVPSVAK